MSEKLELKIFRDGKEYEIKFKDGNSIKPIKLIKKQKRKVQELLLPSKEIFSSIKFSAAIIEKRIRELAFLNKGISINLIDSTNKKTKEYFHKYDGGILEFVKYINNKKPPLVSKSEKEVFKKPIYLSSTKNNVIVECSFEWNAGGSEEVLLLLITFLKKMGTHLFGFRRFN